MRLCDAHLLEGKTIHQRGIELAHQVYPRIETITREAVTFNDTYGQPDCGVDEETMQARLHHLGGLLHERFELEDCLIEVLHNAHQQEALQKA